MNTVVLRNSLSVLATKVSAYGQAVRDAGFSCCHNEDDWIARNCTEIEIALHQRYLVEYARESLMCDSNSAILMGDGVYLHSLWLRQLKENRLSKFGTADEILKSEETRHLIELSPCLRQLSRIRSSHDPDARKQHADLVEEFIKRREWEFRAHRDGIKFVNSYLGGALGEVSLQSVYASLVMESFRDLGACNARAVQMYATEEVTVFEIGKSINFVLIPIIACTKPSDGGSVGMGFRLAGSETLSANKYEKDKYVVVHLHSLLPKGFSEYGHYRSSEELSLNVLAWIAALRVILPGVLTKLRETVIKLESSDVGI